MESASREQTDLMGSREFQSGWTTMLETGVHPSDAVDECLRLGVMHDVLPALLAVVDHIDDRVLEFDGKTLLGAAASFGDEAAVERLIGLGASVNATDTEELTPLHSACDQGSVASEGVIGILLCNGANPLQLDQDGRSSLELAILRSAAPSLVVRMANHVVEAFQKRDPDRSILEVLQKCARLCLSEDLRKVALVLEPYCRDLSPKRMPRKQSRRKRRARNSRQRMAPVEAAGVSNSTEADRDVSESKAIVQHALGKETRKEDATDECVVCLDASYCVVLVPCHHMCLCVECAESIENCPICRQGITSRIRVFKS